jgi:hypothetical protein
MNRIHTFIIVTKLSSKFTSRFCFFFPGQIKQTLIKSRLLFGEFFLGNFFFDFYDVKKLVVKISPKIAKLVKFTLEKKNSLKNFPKFCFGGKMEKFN